MFKSVEFRAQGLRVRCLGFRGLGVLFVIAHPYKKDPIQIIFVRGSSLQGLGLPNTLVYLKSFQTYPSKAETMGPRI